MSAPVPRPSVSKRSRSNVAANVKVPLPRPLAPSFDAQGFLKSAGVSRRVLEYNGDIRVNSSLLSFVLHD